MIKPFSAPLLFAHELAAQTVVSTGGTALLWKPKNGKFIVSGAHVWREFEERQKKVEGRIAIVLGMAGNVVSLAGVQPVDINDDLDIVVLPAPTDIEDRLGKKKFYETPSWPARPARDGETVGILGFPGELRRTQGFTLETNSFYYENTCAVSVRGTNMLIGGFQAEPPVTVVHVSEPTNSVESFGGISGAPVFALRDGAPTWVGVVKRGAEGRGIEAGIQASPSHLVREDGRILVH